MPHARPTPGHPHAMMFILFISGLGLSYVFFGTVVLHFKQSIARTQTATQQNNASDASPVVPTQVEITPPVSTSVEVYP
jgi:hypothetical protein